MPAEANKALNLRRIQAWNARDWATEAACRTPDYQAHMSGIPTALDAAGWDAFTQSFITAFPNAQITVDDAAEEGNLVASRWTITGTHRGEFQGVPATERPITMAGVDFSRVVDGKIAEHWSQFDVLALMRQIGALPAPA
jgi:steroid delta-isomerase-like uncharacterized protein